jgi:hypothetical protein
MSKALRDPMIPICQAFLAAWVIFSLFFFRGCGKTGRDRAVQEISEAGGRVEVDENKQDRPPVRVEFEGPLGDDGLARVRPHLESLPRLRHLRITSMAMISDAGLKSLEKLTQLETIELYGGAITESGINALRKKLPSVQINYSVNGLFPATMR